MKHRKTLIVSILTLIMILTTSICQPVVAAEKQKIEKYKTAPFILNLIFLIVYIWVKLTIIFEVFLFLIDFVSSLLEYIFSGGILIK